VRAKSARRGARHERIHSTARPLKLTTKPGQPGFVNTAPATTATAGGDFLYNRVSARIFAAGCRWHHTLAAFSEEDIRQNLAAPDKVLRRNEALPKIFMNGSGPVPAKVKFIVPDKNLFSKK
jgi:hypothetical protein